MNLVRRMNCVDARPDIQINEERACLSGWMRAAVLAMAVLAVQTSPASAAKQSCRDLIPSDLTTSFEINQNGEAALITCREEALASPDDGELRLRWGMANFAARHDGSVRRDKQGEIPRQSG
ncbi:hypothetical protein [Paracoccus marinaquae]|uniref:Uncharacterized protein n=1 Tax=Paracoccus marinaquae TaxID=2841926 RepID=A0ABS6APA1_9RHOB|nr:hypothetical protein [Paracoccus marinaquae]MBU3032413.1 hypothetical protein [Paracoccus marinaquae]